MIIASITRNGNSLPVEVVDTFTTGDGRKLAVVRALSGQPFTQWTHGGPSQSDSAYVPVDYLANLAASVDLATVRIEVTK